MLQKATAAVIARSSSSTLINPFFCATPVSYTHLKQVESKANSDKVHKKEMCIRDSDIGIYAVKHITKPEVVRQLKKIGLINNNTLGLV